VINLVKVFTALGVVTTCWVIDWMPAIETDSWGYRHFYRRGYWGHKAGLLEMAERLIAGAE
jgi:hypothetical protein